MKLPKNSYLLGILFFGFALSPVSLPALPTDGLTAYWTFEDSINPFKNSSLASGNIAPANPANLDLTNVNNVSVDVNGLIGAAARFDGTSKYLTVANPVVEESPFTEATISVWFKVDRVPTESERFSIFETSANYTLSLGLRESADTSKTTVQVFTNTTTAPYNTTVEVLDEVFDGWVHVTTTLSTNSDLLTLTVNGGTSGELNASIAIDAASVPLSFTDFRIGTYRSANARFFPGLIDELAVWDRVLSEDELSIVEQTNSTSSFGEILLVENLGGLAGFGTLAADLRAAGYSVTEVNDELAKGHPNLLNGGLLDDFDLVVYSERGSVNLPAAVAASLEAYIQGGGHLLVTGADTIGQGIDTELVSLVRATNGGDLVSVNSTWLVADIDHPIINGPFGDFRGLEFTAKGYDDDQLNADTARGAVELVSTGNPRVTGKVIFTDLPFAGSVGYWNGGEFVGTNPITQPDFTDGGNAESIFRNYVDFVVGIPVPDIVVADIDGDGFVTVILDGSRVHIPNNGYDSFGWFQPDSTYADGLIAEVTIPADGISRPYYLDGRFTGSFEELDRINVTAYSKEAALFTDFATVDAFFAYGTVEGTTLAIADVAYRLVGGQWVSQQLVSGLGASEVIDEDTIISYDSFNGSNFRVFRFSGGSWIGEDINIDVVPPQSTSFNGFQYAFSDSRVVISNPRGNDFAGRIFVYDLDLVANELRLDAELTPVATYPIVEAGAGIAIEGDRIIASRLGPPEGGSTRGLRILYDIYTDSSSLSLPWSYTETLAPQAPLANQFDGFVIPDVEIENGVILTVRQKQVDPLMTVLEYDSITGWVETNIPLEGPYVQGYYFYEMNDDGNSFVFHDESGNFTLCEKGNPSLKWSDPDVNIQQRRLLVSDLIGNRDLQVTDFSDGRIVITDFELNIVRVIDTSSAVRTINAEPIADAGSSDIVSTSLDGSPVRVFLNGGGTTDLNYDEVLDATWTWTNGDGSTGSAKGLQTFANLPVDVSEVILTVIDSQNAVSRDSLNVSITSPPKVDPLPDVFVVDANGDGQIQLFLDANSPSPNIASWNWRWPGGTLNSQSGVVTLGATANGERVILEVVDTNGLATETEFRFKLLDPNPTPAIIQSSDGAPLDEFGGQVAIKGETALIGALSKRFGGVPTGATYVAEYLNNNWSEYSLDSGFRQGASLSLEEDYVFSGVKQDGDSSILGGVRVYQQASGLWEFQEALPEIQTDNGFGQSLAREGNYLIVGAPESYTLGNNDRFRLGAAHLFELQTDGSWDFAQTFEPVEDGTYINFGTSVAIFGDTIAITTKPGFLNDYKAYLYIYEKGETGWEFVQRFLKDFGTDEGSYGASLAMNENEIIVGSPKIISVGLDPSFQAVVYRYTKNELGVWEANGVIEHPGSTLNFGRTSFGQSLALKDDVLVIGAPLDYESGDNGLVYVYRLVDGVWINVATQINPQGSDDDLFGISVDHDGENLIVGASEANNSAGIETGLAYIYRNYAALNPAANYEPVADAGADINVSDTIERDTVDPFPITEPLGSEPVVLNAGATIDNENAIASYDWTWLGGSASGVNPTARFPVGTTTVTLTVIDDQGIVSTDTVDVTVSLAQADPAALPDVSANSLTVNLPVPVALWRLSSEFLWHADGATISDVEVGETYQLEILGYAGSPDPITTLVTIDSANTIADLNVTLPIAATQTGTIRFPETEQGFSWRLTGESVWRNVADNSDEIEDILAFSLPVGANRIEFKPVSGYATPQSRTINVSSGLSLSLNWGEYLRINNFDSSKTFEVIEAPNLAAPPYQFVGKIRTPLGRGSGTVVAERVVLTAAHLFFDFNGLQWSDVQWFPRQQQGVRQAAPVLPRGILYRTSYAKLVAPDSVEGTVDNLPEDDQEVDFAVLYFSDSTAWEGGSANFLQSTDQQNWLTGPESKHALGYPQRSQAYPDRGKMFEKIFSTALSSLDSGALPLLYESSEVFGDGGASGSALFVQPNGGTEFYPAAVLLAGQGRGVYRIIDGDVTRMIKDGEDAASGNDDVLDSNSSLVTYQNLGGLTGIAVDISPGAVLSTARWSITPNTGTGFANLLPSQMVPFVSIWDSFTVSFTAVSGYSTPAPVFLTAGQISLGGLNTIENIVYQPLSGFDDWLQVNAIADPLDDSDGDQRSALLEYATDGDPTVYDFLEVVKVVPTPSGSKAQYQVYVSADADSILYEVKAVSSLDDINDPAKVELLATFTRSDGPGYQTVTDTKTFAEASSRFVWLEVTHNRELSTQ